MSEYKLYKAADNGDATDEAKRQAMMQALLALSGGGLGYLLTRYGLGLKGAGAGIAGAGLGAVAGAGAGAVLNRMAQEQQKKDIDFEITKAQAKQNRNRDPLAEGVTAANPLSLVMDKPGGDPTSGKMANIASAGTTGVVGLRKGYQALTDQLVPDKAKTNIMTKRINKTLANTDEIKKIVEDAAKAGRQFTGKEKAKLAKLLSSGVNPADTKQILNAVSDLSNTAGVTNKAQKLLRAEQDLLKPLVSAAPDASKVPFSSKAFRFAGPVGGTYIGTKWLGQLIDAYTKKEGSKKYVDEQGNEYE